MACGIHLVEMVHNMADGSWMAWDYGADADDVGYEKVEDLEDSLHNLEVAY